MQRELGGSGDAGYAGELFNFMCGSEETAVFFFTSAMCFVLFFSAKQPGSGESKALLLPGRGRESRVRTLTDRVEPSANLRLLQLRPVQRYQNTAGL